MGEGKQKAGGEIPEPRGGGPPVNYSGTGVENPFSGAPVWYTAETGSTMDDAAAYLSAGGTLLSGTVLWAGYQLAGKGRLPGRVWLGAPGKNLLFTLILHRKDFPRPPQLFPLLAGLALCRTLEHGYRLAPEIKWPNDVIVHGKKCAGILGRMHGNWFLLGMGINCNQVRFPEEIRSAATSLELETGAAADTASLLQFLLENCRDAFPEPAWRDAIESRLAYRGKNVEVFTRGDEPEGFPALVAGIDEEGRLRYRRPGRESEEFLAAGEIRPGKERAAGG